MLISFRLENYRSFHEAQELSLVANSGKEQSNNTFSVEVLPGLRLLRSIVLYGANASGKSNFLRGMAFLRSFILRSTDNVGSSEPIAVDPFGFAANASSKPSNFEMIFIVSGVRYQYGFTVDSKRVYREWLFAYPKGSPQKWFIRSAIEGESWTFSSHFKGDKKGLSEKTADNALFLTVCAQFNHPQIKPIVDWVEMHFGILGGSNTFNYTAKRCVKDVGFREKVVQLLRDADVGITDLKASTVSMSDEDMDKVSFKNIFSNAELSEVFRKEMIALIKNTEVARIELLHKIKNSNELVPFNLEDESDGTRRYFAMTGPWLDVLEVGKLLLVDEMNTNLHPLLSRRLVELFHSHEYNAHSSQLIFTTHDTTLLDPSLFRRDQIWFFEKNQDGASRLYPLSDYQPRKDEALQRGYLAGRYGAIPFLGEFRY